MGLFFSRGQPPPNIGLAMLDIYTTYAAVVPLMSKLRLDGGTGIHEALDTTGQKPHILNTVDDGSLTSNLVITYHAHANINHSITRGHPHYIDKFIGAFDIFVI